MKSTPVSAQIDLPPLALRAVVRPDSVNAEQRTAEVVFSTGAPVSRFDWGTGQRYTETLSLKPKDIRLDRLNDGAPFLNAHSAFDLSDVLGVVVSKSARVVDGQAIATIRFSKRDTVEPIWRDVRTASSATSASATACTSTSRRTRPMRAPPSATPSTGALRNLRRPHARRQWRQGARRLDPD